MDLELLEVHWPQLIAQEAEPVMQQSPRKSRFPAPGVSDEHHCGVCTLQHGRVNEVEVGPQLLEFDRDVLIEESEKCTVVGCREESTTSSPDEERRRYAVPTDDVVEVRHIGALLHRAIRGGDECRAQGFLTMDVDAALQHSQLDDLHDDVLVRLR